MSFKGELQLWKICFKIIFKHILQCVNNIKSIDYYNNVYQMHGIVLDFFLDIYFFYLITLMPSNHCILFLINLIDFFHILLKFVE